MMMKKPLMFVLCLALVLSLVGCGSKDEGTASPKSYTEIMGKTIECEAFAALLPDGWSNSPCEDIWADDGSLDPDKLMFVKADLEANPMAALSSPSVTVIHHSDDAYILDVRDMYTDTVDVSFELNGVKWTGYTGKYGSYTNGVLSVKDSTEWEISTNFSSDDGEISFYDPEVQAILASLKVK